MQRRLLRIIIIGCQQVRAPSPEDEEEEVSSTRIASIMAKKEGTTGKCQAITMDKWENKRLALFGFASFRSSAENAQMIFSRFSLSWLQPADNRKPFTIGPASPRLAPHRLPFA